MANPVQIPTPAVVANPFAQAPVSAPAPSVDLHGAASSVASSIKSNLAAAGNRAAAPVASSPFASAPVDAGPPLARQAQPLLAPGTSAFKPLAPVTFGTVPGLTASFTQPPKTTTKAPAVVTADAATDHIDTMKQAANAANTDIQNAAAAKANIAANAAAASASAKPTTGSGETGASKGSDYDSQINDIIASLGGDTPKDGQGQANQQNVQDIQQNEAGVLQAENAIDSNTLQTVDNALTSLESGTMPLTPNEQAQVDDVKNKFSSALAEAQSYAQNVLGGMAARDAGGENGGLAMYSPKMAMANIASAIKIGADKINKVNSDILSAQAQLTKSLQDGDYRTASRLYNKISSSIDSRNKEIDKINTSIQTHIDKMQTQALDVAKLQIQTLTSAATRDATAAYHAEQMIYNNARLSETERHDMITELNSANNARSAGERSLQAAAQFSSAFVPGATMSDGTPVLDPEGWVTPVAWKAAIADAPAEGMTRQEFLKNFGQYIYADAKKGIDAKKYGLTPADIKVINGALPAAQ